MTKINISVECATEDEALDIIGRIAGVSEVAAPKKSTPKQKAAAATTEEATPPKKPAKVKKAAKKKAKPAGPTDEALKDHILEHAGDMTEPSVAGQVKEYITSFGVSKISDMTDEQRQEAYDGAEDYFDGGDEVEEDEDDPMA